MNPHQPYHRLASGAGDFLRLLVLFLLFASPSVAQKRDLVVGAGPEFGVALLRGALNVYRSSPDCGEFLSGSAAAYGFSLSGAAPHLFNERWGLAARVRWESSSDEFSALPVDPQKSVDRESGKLIDIDRQFRLTSTIRSLGFDLLGRYGYGERLSFGIGPFLGYRFSTTFMQTDNIYGPARPPSAIIARSIR